MNLNEVIDIIRDKNNSRELYFCEKNRDSYISVCPEVSEDIFDMLIGFSIDTINKRMEEELIKYNPIGYREGTIEVCNTDYVGNFEEVINSFDPGNIDIKEEEIDKFAFYCINIGSGEKNVKLFRRLTKFRKLSTKGILGIFQGNQLNRIDDKILGVDGDIDLVIYKNEILVLRHISLERIFKVEEQYEKKSKETIDYLRNTGKIKNFDAFEEDCMNDSNIRKILTKMQNENNNLERCFDNFDNIVETIDIFQLPININEEEKSIIYEDKTQIRDILRLARDSYYKSIIQEKPGIDNKI